MPFVPAKYSGANPNTFERMERGFFLGALCVLVLVGASELLTAVNAGQKLDALDPVAGVTARAVLLSAVGLKITVVVSLLRGKESSGKLLMILSLCGVFGLYRIGLWAVGGRQLCPCLGQMGTWLGWTMGQQKWVSLVLLFLLASGACALLVARALLDACARSASRR